VGESLAACDFGGDGAVTIEEALARRDRVPVGECLGRTCDWVAEIDADGDGRIPAADIAPQN